MLWLLLFNCAPHWRLHIFSTIIITLLTSTLWCFDDDYDTTETQVGTATHLQEQQQHQLQKPELIVLTHTSNNYNDSSITAPMQILQPYFENTTQRSLIAAVGRTAKLHCRVQNLEDRAVSWIRKRDLHILTIGVMTYTNDQRFQAQHHDESDEWLLKIESVQSRDSGIYECQVSTEPKISQAYRLNVLVAKAKILANQELVFKSGSDINLTCIAHQAPMPPSYIYWYKDGDLINYSQRGGINVLTERQTKTSKLLIAKVVPTDSGNYTCVPSNSNSDSVFVHVIKSEHPAAMQHEHSTSLKSSIFILGWTLISSYFHKFCWTRSLNISYIAKS